MIKIDIGGEKRPFKFGINAARIFCKETGKGLDALDKINQTDIESVINVIYAGLFQGAKMTNKEIDFDTWKVGEWLDDVNDKEITKAFNSLGEEGRSTKKKAVQKR